VLVTSHVLAGAVLGELVRRPVPAFAAGFLSHVAMDLVPHWGCEPEDFLPYAVKDGLVGLTAVAAVTAGARPARRPAVMAGVVGAVLPDLDKPSELFFGRSPFPARFDDFHDRIQTESPHRMPYELVAGAALALVAGVLLRRAR
jgi:hypothetical protein